MVQNGHYLLINHHKLLSALGQVLVWDICKISNSSSQNSLRFSRYKVCSKWAPRRCLQTLTRRWKLSMTPNGWNAMSFVSLNLVFCRCLKQGLDLMLTNFCDDWSIIIYRFEPFCNDRLCWATLYVCVDGAHRPADCCFLGRWRLQEVVSCLLCRNCVPKGQNHTLWDQGTLGAIYRRLDFFFPLKSRHFE